MMHISSRNTTAVVSVMAKFKIHNPQVLKSSQARSPSSPRVLL